MAIAAVSASASASPSFPSANGSSSTPATAFPLRAGSHGSSSRRDEIDPFPEGEEVGGPSSRALLGEQSASAGDGSCPILPPDERNVVVHASRPGWYKELYAWVTEKCRKSYEAEGQNGDGVLFTACHICQKAEGGQHVKMLQGMENKSGPLIAAYKQELFAHLRGPNKKILELGVGTGPNIRYYANATGVDVFGIDPNERMEKYAWATAARAGLPSANFHFIQGVAEALPIRENSMDAVVGTLVLCSVHDVDTTLREVKRVLKPGGLYIFIEHVAARDGSLRRLAQGVLDPLQQFVADGCHLTRETAKDISRAGFSDVHINTASISTLSIVSPHIYGIACK